MTETIHLPCPDEQECVQEDWDWIIKGDGDA